MAIIYGFADRIRFTKATGNAIRPRLPEGMPVIRAMVILYLALVRLSINNITLVRYCMHAQKNTADFGGVAQRKRGERKWAI
jgi:hypothetical protein